MTAGITFFRSSGFPFFTVARTWGEVHRTKHEMTTFSMYPATHHVPAAGGRQPVEPAPDAVDRDDVEVLAAGVVRAVHHGAHRARQRDAELGPRRSATSWSGTHILL